MLLAVLLCDTVLEFVSTVKLTQTLYLFHPLTSYSLPLSCLQTLLSASFQFISPSVTSFNPFFNLFLICSAAAIQPPNVCPLGLGRIWSHRHSARLSPLHPGDHSFLPPTPLRPPPSYAATVAPSHPSPHLSIHRLPLFLDSCYPTPTTARVSLPTTDLCVCACVRAHAKPHIFY